MGLIVAHSLCWPVYAFPAPLIWYVAATGSDLSGDGSATRPFASIGQAIDAARNGDTVLVGPGTYRENVAFEGKDITLASLYLETGDANYILSTVIDGGRMGHAVTFASGERFPSLIGFTVTNGYAAGDDPTGTRGGGIFCWEAGSPTLAHLRVIGNEAVSEGGGLFFAHCAPVVRDVYVVNNRAGEGGGGIRYSYGSIDIQNVVLTGNAGGSGGSGMMLYHAGGMVRNALIADNLGGGKGGGVALDGCSPTFVNVTIAGNRTAGSGGGLNVSYMSAPRLVNSIVWGNSPEQIYFDTDWGGEAVTIEYSGVEGGQAGIVTNGQGSVHWGEGNFPGNPQFAHPGLGNYRLRDNSPAIGAGRAWDAAPVDIESAPRPNPPGTRPDVGAYEHASARPSRAYYVPWAAFG
jgi:hypothetical protein